jgi:predicted nucleic acid-binding Zn ribbon protein
VRTCRPAGKPVETTVETPLGTPDEHPVRGRGLRTAGPTGSTWPARSRAAGEAGRAAPTDDRDPQLLDSVVARLVGDHGWELSLRVHGAMARWPEIVGEDIAAHTVAESFVDGRLTVRADSTAWATQLKLLVPTLLTRLNEELGQGSVTLLEVLGPQAPSWARGGRRVRGGRGPRDTYG